MKVRTSRWGARAIIKKQANKNRSWEAIHPQIKRQIEDKKHRKTYRISDLQEDVNVGNLAQNIDKDLYGEVITHKPSPSSPQQESKE